MPQYLTALKSLLSQRITNEYIYVTYIHTCIYRYICAWQNKQPLSIFVNPTQYMRGPYGITQQQKETKTSMSFLQEPCTLALQLFVWGLVLAGLQFLPTSLRILMTT